MQQLLLHGAKAKLPWAIAQSRPSLGSESDTTTTAASADQPGAAGESELANQPLRMSDLKEEEEDLLGLMNEF